MLDKEEQRRRATEFEKEQLAAGAVKPILQMPVVKPAKIGPKDKLNREFTIGDTVLRADSSYAGRLYFSKVTKIDGLKVYLDNSHVSLNYPGRVVIVNEIPNLP